MKLSFFVPGIPAPGGSKRFVGFGKKTHRAILIDAAGEKNKNWRSSVAQCGNAARMVSQLALLSVPLEVEFIFAMPRPKGHYTPKGVLRASAPVHHTTRPDVLKLSRSTEDALTGVIWLDDSQTVTLHATKRFVSTDEGCGCYITVKLPSR